MSRLVKKNSQEEDRDYGFKIQKKQNRPSKFYVRWTQEENKDYAHFLLLQKPTFEQFQGKKNNMLFSKMASFLRNGRDNHQCRSHHVKMMRKFGALQNIIGEYLGTQQKQTENSQNQTTLNGKIPLFQIKDYAKKKSEIQLKIISDPIMKEEVELFNLLSGPVFSFIIDLNQEYLTSEELGS